LLTKLACQGSEKHLLNISELPSQGSVDSSNLSSSLTMPKYSSRMIFLSNSPTSCVIASRFCEENNPSREQRNVCLLSQRVGYRADTSRSGTSNVSPCFKIPSCASHICFFKVTCGFSGERLVLNQTHNKGRVFV